MEWILDFGILGGMRLTERSLQEEQVHGSLEARLRKAYCLRGSASE